MPNYQHRFGKHNIGIHYEPNHTYFKNADQTPMFEHPIIDAWPIESHSYYPVFTDEITVSDKVWSAYLQRLTKVLNTRFTKQRKSKAWIHAFFSDNDISPKEIEEAEKIEYGSKEIEEAAVEADIIKPNFDAMVKADLFKWLVSHDEFDLNVDNKKDELVEKCEEIWASLDIETETE